MPGKTAGVLYEGHCLRRQTDGQPHVSHNSTVTMQQMDGVCAAAQRSPQFLCFDPCKGDRLGRIADQDAIGTANGDRASRQNGDVLVAQRTWRKRDFLPLQPKLARFRRPGRPEGGNKAQPRHRGRATQIEVIGDRMLDVSIMKTPAFPAL